MSSVVVVAVLYPTDGAKEQLVEALRQTIPAVHQERGCELYSLHGASNGTIVMIEKWASMGDLQAHNEGPAIAELIARTASLVAKPATVVVMNPLAAGDDRLGAI